MHNKVVFAAAEAFFSLGCEVLRFNFRGVGLSAGTHDFGKGEVEDARGSDRTLRKRHPGMACHSQAFRLALELHCRRLVAIVTGLGDAVPPSFRFFDPTLVIAATPKLFVQGTPKLCPPEDLRGYTLISRTQVCRLVRSAEHFAPGRSTLASIVDHRQFLGAVAGSSLTPPVR
jgi:hypothetical protein